MTNSEHSERRNRLAWKIEHNQCLFPDCERPSAGDPGDKFPICALHQEGTNAQADLDEAELAENILEPWVDTTEAIGYDVLTRVMQGALMDLRREKEELQERIAKAYAALDED